MTAPGESAGRPQVAFGCALLLSMALICAPAVAETCDRSGCGLISCGNPARPAPQSYWGELQPVDANPLSLSRDSTAFNEFLQNYSTFPWFTGVEAQNGYLVTSLAYGLAAWDLRTHPENPDLLGKLNWDSFPVWVDNAEEKWPIQDLAMPAGVDTTVALAGHAGIGIAIVDLSDKTHPHFQYQSYKKNGEEVYATTLGGTQYAFLAASGGDPSGGVFAYNMSQASQYSNCAESAPADSVFCPGVYLGMIGNRTSAAFIHGVDNFIVFSSGSGGGFEIWNVADPRHPQMVLTALHDSPACLFDLRSVYGVAMWKGDNSHYYLGLRTEKFSCTLVRNVNEARIYDVTCNLNGSCNSLGNPIFTQELDSGTPNYFVTFSRSRTTPFLYFGSDDKCRGGNQREWLFDVTNPASARDITPPTGYWGWYYRGGVTGFNNEMPRRGKFYNEFFYRAALSLFDIHKRTAGVPPTASFIWTPQTEIYPGIPVQFQDTSSAFPSGWNWTFTDLPPGLTAPTPPTTQKTTPPNP